jgi:hypothetical protein
VFFKEKHQGRLALPVLLKIRKTKKLNSQSLEREKQQRKLSKLSPVGDREKTGIRKESQASLGR